MNGRSQAHVTQPAKITTPSFMPVQSGLLQRKCACGGTPGVDGGCAECREKRLSVQRRAANPAGPPPTVPPMVHEVLNSSGQPLDAGTRAFMEPRFGHDFGRVKIHATVLDSAQTKLTVNQPGDKYEQEADQVAQQVMRMPESETSRSQSLSRNPDEIVQRKETSDQASTITSDVQAHINSMRGSGRPLPESTRAFMEPRFGHDFSHVRIHADDRAAETARAVNAQAFTLGRDIVFGSGAYAPGTATGQRLLAHELTHVVQQHGSGTQSSIQRKFRPEELLTPAHKANRPNPVATDPDTYFYAGSQQNTSERRALVIAGIHGNEESAGNLGKEANQQLSSGTVQADFHTIVIPQVSPESGRFSKDLDPNREFGTTYDSPIAFVRRVKEVVNEFDPERILSIHAISEENLAGVFLDPIHKGAYPSTEPSQRGKAFTGDQRNVEAMHLTEAMIESVGKASGSTPSPDKYTPGNKPRKDFPASEYPAPSGGQSAYSLIYPKQGEVNQPKGQKPPTKDPEPTSLGVWASGLGKPVVTIEIPGFKAKADVWKAFLPAVWTFLRIPPSSSQPGKGQATNQPTAGGSVLGGFGAWLGHLLHEVIRVVEQLGTMPEPLPRKKEALPAGLKCKLFDNQADLDARKAYWVTIINSMPLPDVISWIIGVKAPQHAAAEEAKQQKDCLLAAIGKVAKRPDSGVKLPPGKLTESPYRSFEEQKAIWTRKFKFLRKKDDRQSKKFGRISAQARDACKELIKPDEKEWNPEEARHRRCWVAQEPLLQADKDNGVRKLDDNERQFEILQTSSAPGISRHHWGTDFDLFDPTMDPALWEKGGPFAGEYSWMMLNASTYGFIQPFTATSTFMRQGYTEERWHWSYYPVAQALLEFAQAHQDSIQQELEKKWGTDPQFSFIRQHWQEYMFNVGEQAVFEGPEQKK